MVRTGTILVTGGTGVTGKQVVSELIAAGASHLVASRSLPAGMDPAQHVKFDWADETTWSSPFEKREDITGVYLVAPYLPNTEEVASKFIDFAVARTKAQGQGKIRFVLLNESGSELSAEKPLFMVAIHHYLAAEQAKGVLEYASVNCTGFATNFSEAGHPNVEAIKGDGIIHSGAGEGKVPWVAVEDIAATAATLLLADEALNGSVVVLGPELLSYTDVAAIIAEETGRKVQHQPLSKSAFVSHLENDLGLPAFIAEWLGEYDEGVAGGSEERIWADEYKRNGIKRTTGRDPITFREFVRKNKAVWQS